MISILKCFKHTPIRKNQNNIKLYSKFRFLDAVVTSYDFKNNVLFNKVKDFMDVTTSSVKDWYTYFTSTSEAKHMKDVLIKQKHLRKMQDERREIGKLITDVRKLFIEKQDKIFQINRWENIHEYVKLRKEEAVLIRKEYELLAKFEALDKYEKELFEELNDTVRGTYEREKAKKVYTKYWGAIFSIVIVMLSVLSMMPREVTIRNSTVEKKPFYISDVFNTQMSEKSFYASIDSKTQINESAFVGVVTIATIVVMILICGTCR